MSTTATFEDDSSFQEASGSVRNDSADAKYVIVGHVNDDPLRIQVEINLNFWNLIASSEDQNWTIRLSSVNPLARNNTCTYWIVRLLTLKCQSGPHCSKLTTSLVNVSLKFQKLISQIHQYFLLKKCEKLLQCKSFSYFVNKKFQYSWL